MCVGSKGARIVLIRDFLRRYNLGGQLAQSDQPPYTS
jgi:hypothetical protein